MRPRSAAAVVLLVLGCWSSRAPGPGPGAEAPAANITSCAIDPPVRVPQDVRLIERLGRAGDRTWALVRRGLEAVVVGLGPDGALVELPVGGEPRATHVGGTRLWIANARATAGVDLVGVELAGARPAIAQRASLALAPLHGVSAFAASASRVLVADHGAGTRLQLFDLRRGAPLGAPVAIASTELEPPRLRCAGDRCFALGVEGDGPSRRLFVERFAPDGAHEHEQLAGDHVDTYLLAALGERSLAVWRAPGDGGVFVFARALDAAGRPLTPRTRIHAAGTSDVEVVADPERPQIAFRTAGGWSFGALSPRALGPILVAPTGMPSTYFLAGASMPDGMLLVAYASGVDYQGGYHSWSGEAHAAFVRRGDTPEPALPIASMSGDGRAGIAAVPLVAPGHAAVLVAPWGPEAGSGGELIVLRRPCTAAAARGPAAR